MGAKALFEEKYGEEVRVVRIPGFCAELCGGTHVDATGDIGLFKIVREEGIGADARRITAVAGMPAFNCLRQAYEELRGAAERLGADMLAVCDQIGSLQDEIKSLRRALEEAKLQALAARIDDILSKREEVGGVSVVTAAFDGADVGLLRELGDRVKSRQPRSLVVLASRDGARAQLVIMADEAAVRAGVHAGKLAKEVASLAGGGGGGKAQTAQVGGVDPSKVEEALSGVPEILRRMLNS
jgi:alanyl-tRNA synthetase